jgi:hypothetical protein
MDVVLRAVRALVGGRIRSAAVGVVDGAIAAVGPLDTDPVTTTVDALEVKKAAARGHCSVAVDFWAGIVPANSKVGALAEGPPNPRTHWPISTALGLTS